MLQNKVKEIHSKNDEGTERNKLKAKLYGMNSQMDALGERVAILPREVSPVPLFKQMEKLEVAKKELGERLLKVKDLNLSERLVSIEAFEHFAQIASKTLKENPDFNSKRSLLQKFIYRVEIGVDSVKIYWNLDQEFFERELKIKKPEARDSGILKTSANVSSQSLTNGAQDWSRGR